MGTVDGRRIYSVSARPVVAQAQTAIRNRVAVDHGWGFVVAFNHQLGIRTGASEACSAALPG